MAIAEADLSGRRVLVVEDEARIAMLIRDTLEDMGCEVVAIATRFDDALQKACSLPFDVALLDVNLDGEPSYPIAAALAERGRAFVFATGYGASNVPAALNKAPVLQKPFLRRDLERALRQALI
ncbi:MAG TPA: response regulator [Rhodanobacteraceae bacterium]|nr:response regulator [Rhodanobacteraceae bacterium]